MLGSPGFHSVQPLGRSISSNNNNNGVTSQDLGGPASGENCGSWRRPESGEQVIGTTAVEVVLGARCSLFAIPALS